MPSGNAVVVRVAAPLGSNSATANAVLLSLNVTWPEGTAFAETTFAVNVTGAPLVTTLADEVRVVVVAAIEGGGGITDCSNPNTATLFGVPTKTLPSATVGTMNLFPGPN